MKATYGEVMLENGELDKREIFKDPITDDGTKKSAKGLLRVEEVLTPILEGEAPAKSFKLIDQVTEDMEKGGALQTVFLNGKLLKFQTLSEIRARVKYK